jgi:adenosylcobinamide-GDP ribazoletransferase
MRGLVTAIRTLTVLWVPGRDAARPASALPWFPLVGGLIGGLVFLPAWGLELAGRHWSAVGVYKWPAGVAALLVTLAALLTGGLHLDGLADWADGFFGAREREKILAIMKDPRKGTFGVVALILVLLAKWAALARIVEWSGLLPWIVAAAAASRFCQVELAASLPYARAEGGTAAPFVSGAKWWHRVVAFVLVMAVCMAACGPAGAGAPLVGWIIMRFFRRRWRKRIGGVTGDLLGAGSELVETALLFIVAAAGPELGNWTGWIWLRVI